MIIPKILPNRRRHRYADTGFSAFQFFDPTGHGHDYEQLVDEALKRGLVLAPVFVATLKALQELGAFSLARYPFVGTKREIGLEVLSSLCNALAPLIGPRVLGTIPSARTDIIEPI